MKTNWDAMGKSPLQTRLPQEGARPALTLSALLLQFLKIGSIGFGGGMAVIALMERDLILKGRAMEMDEFLHGIGLGQVLGPFAVNTALFIGNRLYGPLGGLACAFAFMAPSVLIVILLAWLYFSFHAVPERHRGTGAHRYCFNTQRGVVYGPESRALPAIGVHGCHRPYALPVKGQRSLYPYRGGPDRSDRGNADTW
ncbi:MAG: chromate transporter [Nitrospiraceae bacterium]|nr:chromate transporter [Nitrospiraceae bacterium]